MIRRPVPSRRGRRKNPPSADSEPHINRTALARWFNRTATASEKRDIDRHFLFCRDCQRKLTLNELVEVAIEAKERLNAATRAAERN